MKVFITSILATALAGGFLIALALAVYEVMGFLRKR